MGHDKVTFNAKEVHKEAKQNKRKIDSESTTAHIVAFLIRRHKFGLVVMYGICATVALIVSLR